MSTGATGTEHHCMYVGGVSTLVRLYGDIYIGNESQAIQVESTSLRRMLHSTAVHTHRHTGT